MRALVQRVTRASVSVDGVVQGEIDRGFLVLLGVASGDTVEEVALVSKKLAGLRVFEDDEGKMNRDLRQAGGAVLCISQFTLYGDVRRGNRPSFSGAAPPEDARRLYEAFCDAIEGHGFRCGRGVFGAHMIVSLENDGPVTLMIDSDELRKPRNA